MIALLHSPDLSKEVIEMILPELKGEDGAVIQEVKEVENKSPEECQAEIKEFHKLICQHKGETEIVKVMIEIVIRSPHVPTLLIFDLPGLKSASPFSNAGEVSKDILDLILKGSALRNVKPEKIHPLICSTVMCAGSALCGSWAAVTDALNTNVNALGNASIVLTQIDKVSNHTCTNLLQYCIAFLTLGFPWQPKTER